MKELTTCNIPKYLEQGKDHQFWYKNESAKLIELLPEFSNFPIIRTFAVTSMTSSIESNVALALKALIQMKRGVPLKGYLPAQEKYLLMISNGIDVPGRKIMNFIKALEGDENSVVVDIWMCKAFDMLNARILPDGRKYFRSPSKREYDAIESFVLYDAHKRCIEPRQYQSMVWAGVKREFGQTKNVCWSDLLIKKRGFFSYDYKKV